MSDQLTEAVERALELLRANPDVFAGMAGLTDDEAEEIQGRPVLHALLQLSFEQRYRNPEEMVRLAIMARVVAQNLDPATHSPELIADEQARAWAELGNAFRVNDELARAGDAIARAEELRRQGTGGLLLLARIADLKASLLNTQRQLSDACALLESVHQLYLKAGDIHLAGRALVSQGIYTNYWGYPREALGLLKKGLALLDRERDEQLVVSATQSILEVMEQCGEFKAASALLLKSGLRQALAGQPLSLIKLRCVEGRIFAGLGKTRRAEAAFLEARAGFREHQQEYNAALVGLDLAGIWLQQGKTAKVTELAEDMLATFRRLGIQREGLRAMEYLTLASQKKRLTPGLVGHISGFLRKLEREPQLRFEAL